MTLSDLVFAANGILYPTLLVLGFAFGYVARGVLDVDAARVSPARPPARHTGGMTPRRRRIPVYRAVLIALVVFSVLGQLFATTLVVRNGRADVEADVCAAAYNLADGNARDAITEVIQESTSEDLRFHRQLRRLILTPGSDARPTVLAAIDAKIRSLLIAQATRTANPYPPPDLCLDLDDLPAGCDDVYDLPECLPMTTPRGTGNRSRRERG